MKHILKMLAGAMALAFSTTLYAVADTPAGGIGGLAVSPDGGTILAAGDTRVIYQIDPQNMAVTRRIYTGTTVVWMTYSIDGSAIFVRDTSGLLQALDATTFEPLWSMKRTSTADYAKAVNRLIFTIRENREHVVKVVDAGSFQEIATFLLGKDFNPGSLGASPDGLRAVVLSRTQKRPDEVREQPPSDVRDLERVIFQQQHDQRGASIAQISLLTGDVSVTESWYRSDNVKKLAVSVSEAVVLSYGREMAEISADGEVTIISSGARFHYGAGISKDMGTIITGAQKEITFKPRQSDAAQVVKLDALPGWPEYVIRFAHMPDGRLLASTTGYRLIVVDPANGTYLAYPIH